MGFFIVLKYIYNIKVAFKLFFSVQFSGINDTHNVMQTIATIYFQNISITLHQAAMNIWVQVSV